MEELLELRAHIEQGRYGEALALISEMEEMGKDDKLHKIGSLIEILLIQLIKEQAEQRTTKSWQVSIQNAVDNIKNVNKRGKSGGWCITNEELRETIDHRYQRALRRASLEAFEGTLTED